jgi:hypothetical protein
MSMQQSIGCAIRDQRAFSWIDTRKPNTSLWCNVRRWYPCVMLGMS